MGQKRAQLRSEKRAREIGEAVKNFERTGKQPPNNFLNKLESSAWPKLSKLKAEQFSVNHRCIGCGQCAALCPKKNIRIVNGRPQIGSDCIQCLSCLQYCPEKAINIGSITESRERYHNPNISPQDLMKKIIHVD